MTASNLRIKSRMRPSSNKNRKTMTNEDSPKNHGFGTILFLFYSTAIIVTCIKFLLIPAYFSTDLEVHRNWMAITYNLPLIEWYTESTSQWTLDYPPFFAYFEYILAYFANFFDEKMLQIQSEPYMSSATLFYMRLTVIVSDLVYYYGVYVWIQLMYQQKRNLFASVPSMKTRSNFFLSSTSFIQITLFLFNVGHLIVDHIHFQYNGFLNGLLLLSMAKICQQEIYWGAFWFAVLLNFKHIYFYMAPGYFIYLLFDHCLTRNAQGLIRIRFKILFRLAMVVIGVFILSFWPFIMNGQLKNVLNRMFPFQRGLSHAYWAPNIWALYNGLDLFMARFSKISSGQASYTSGLVQQSEHLILPTIKPLFSLSIILTILVGIGTVYAWKRLDNNETTKMSRTEWKKMLPSEIRFIHLILLSSLTFYEFGYHVHEKSILLIVPTLITLIFVKVDYARVFLILSTVGYYSLFPLLYKEAEAMLKFLLLIIHLVFSFGTLNSRYRIVGRWLREDVHQPYDSDEEPVEQQQFQKQEQKRNFFQLPLLDSLESVYIYGLLILYVFHTIGPYVFPGLFGHFQFLPLMMISLYCSIGIISCYIYLMKSFLVSF